LKQQDIHAQKKPINAFAGINVSYHCNKKSEVIFFNQVDLELNKTANDLTRSQKKVTDSKTESESSKKT